jgi:predicted 2-oxoglutarate/Fe(II)-dependent dioxygenase YbiX
MDRDYSMLFYVNDDYEGGHINCLMFNYRYEPRRGDLVLFPSDHRYVHTAEPVTRGNRYAIVSWAAVKESRKVKMGPPASAHMVKNPG